ncbi:MAG: sucrase ferredoxin [Cyanobacteria bacterium J055]|nr:MAG: sucrase ferredoxin [Cyanobacteria bacterium J055]
MTPFFCADASRRSAEDLIGSAPAYETYLFIECPQPWTVNVWDSKSVPPNLKAFVESTSRSRSDSSGVSPRTIKVLAIAADKPNPSRKARVLAFHRQPFPSGGYTRREFRVNLEKVAPFLERYLANPEAIRFSATDRPIRDFFVCTHGSHDKCCARYGNPFFRQARTIALNLGLRDVRVWQVSHIGGHRFAPTAIAFPDGRYYGALDGESFAAIAQRKGDIRWIQNVYRGWGMLPRNVQALERELMLQSGWDWFNYCVDCQVLEERPDFVRVEFCCRKPTGFSDCYEAELAENEDKTVYLRGSCGSEKVSEFSKFSVRKLRLLAPSPITYHP